ncbi:MAG: Vps62-related protein, partial [Chloroflexota bacterium]
MNISAIENINTESFAIDEDTKVLKEFAPLVYLHSDEHHFPSSVSWYLERTALKVKGKTKGAIAWQKKYGRQGDVKLNEETLDFIKTYNIGDEEELRLEILKKFGGSHGSAIRGDLSTAECYAYINRTKASYNELSYWFFYPFNGNIATVGKFGLHQGDWEHITIRADKSNSKILEVLFAAHGKEEWKWYPSNHKHLTFADRAKKHLIVYSAKHSHASYPTIGKHLRGHKFGLKGAFSPDRTNKGKKWETWKKLVNVGYDRDLSTYRPSNNAFWMQYPGLWGKLGSDNIFLVSDITGQRKYVPGPKGPAYHSRWASGELLGEYYDKATLPSSYRF